MRQLPARLLIAALFLFSAGCATVQPPVVAPQPPPETSYYQISTRLGDMVVRLYDETPQHRDNFRRLVAQDFYDGTTFHRVIEGFMVQGGDPESRPGGDPEMVGQGGPGYTIEAEIVQGLTHSRGALAAARQGDMVNPERRSSGSQFYIVHWHAPHLDGQYTIFGELVDGFETLDLIAGADTRRRQGQAAPPQLMDQPAELIRMEITPIYDYVPPVEE
jgi:cyclophilin family peptidyl-prolyl cis-trans isomerase